MNKKSCHQAFHEGETETAKADNSRRNAAQRHAVAHPKPAVPIPDDLLYLLADFAWKIQRRYRDFSEDAREERRAEIFARLVAAANKAHEVFREDGGTTYKTHLWRALNWESLKYCRDTKRAILRMSGIEIVSFDAPVNNGDDEEDGSTRGDFIADKAERAAAHEARTEFREILAVLRKRNPYYAHVVDLYLEDLGDDFVAECLGVKKRAFQERVWPKVKAEMRKIGRFLSGNCPVVG